jgi:hypothetical protein
MDSLPQRVFEEILGYLSRGSLKNCSLVAKSWRDISQKALFQSVWVVGLEKWLEFAAKVDVRLPKNVRHLTFFLVGLPAVRVNGKETLPPLEFPPLERLSHLTLDNSHLSLSPQETEWFSPFKFTLSHITLKRCLISKSSFVSLINYFPKLEFLRLEGLAPKLDSRDQTTRISRTLEKLSTSGEFLTFECLNLFDDLSQLGLRFNEVTLEPVDPLKIHGWKESTGRVVDAFGASAERLRLPFVPDGKYNPLDSYRGCPWL